MRPRNAAIIYGTKTGVELTSLGIPAIVAGEAWIRNKGVTTRRSLGRATTADPEPPAASASAWTGEQVRRARMYAYHFFFRRMLPLPFLVPSKSKCRRTTSASTSLEELMPGHYPGLDVICDGILNGTPFIYPAETLGLHETEEVSAAA